MPVNDLKWASSHFSRYNQVYQLYSDYYNGLHRPVFSNPRMSNSFAHLLYGLRDNLMPVVVDSVTDRLQLEGLSSNNTTANDFLTNLWEANRMDTKAGRIHAQAVMVGDSYLIVWPNAQGVPTIYPQKMGQLAVSYTEDDLGNESIAEAIKAWQSPVDGRLRVTRYLPDRIERYATKGKATRIPESLSQLVPFDADGSDAVVDNPYGKVPVFRFANGSDYACSELRDCLPLQNLVNKEMVDMAVASEHQALPQRWLTGAERPIDLDTGQPRKLESGPGVVWNFSDPNTKLGQFDPADLTKFLEVLDNLRTEIARVSRTPLHLLTLGTGQFPSGEALKTAEGPLTSKVRDRQAIFGEVWEDIGRFSCQVAGIAEPEEIEAVWVNTEPHSDKEQSEVMLNKQALGVSRPQILTELGYSPSAIERMAEENAQDTSALADAAMKAFDAGVVA